MPLTGTFAAGNLTSSRTVSRRCTGGGFALQPVHDRGAGGGDLPRRDHACGGARAGHHHLHGGRPHLCRQGAGGHHAAAAPRSVRQRERVRDAPRSPRRPHYLRALSP
eukprot:157669-Pyramimonas_sp.AAC.1